MPYRPTLTSIVSKVKTNFLRTLCPNKSDPLAGFLIPCNKVYRIKRNFFEHIPVCIANNCAKFQKSNCKQNYTNVRLYNYSITTCSQSYNVSALIWCSNCPFFADTATQTLSPLANCSVNDRLIKVAPLINQPFFQMVDFTIHSLLQNAPDRVVSQ